MRNRDCKCRKPLPQRTTGGNLACAECGFAIAPITAEDIMNWTVLNSKMIIGESDYAFRVGFLESNLFLCLTDPERLRRIEAAIVCLRAEEARAAK